MSDNIDQRIVEMSFDNKNFEKGIAQSQKSLNEFNKSLNFDGATRGVESFSASFTKMGAITFGIIQNLTNRVVNFGVRALKSLTLQPVLEGMGDYNTKLTTMQTITNATGKTIAEVEEYFGKLDEYADKTIYNLTDMTSALAKFTNANVSLEKSVPAIKGIANMTALAGQDANAASIAMYNLSQSIAGGFLTTTDFKSLNLANVATFEWKNQMIEAAVAAGTLKKSANGYVTASGKAYGTAQLFTEALSEQWATTDVLLKVLGDYGDETTEIGKKAQAAAQDVKSFKMMVETLRASIGTGWTRSFELIFGDLEESKQLWTNITNAAGAFIDTLANGRNAMLEFWHDDGGREAFINGMRNAAIALVTIMLTVSKGIDKVFPPQTQEQFVNMFKTFERVTKLMIINEETADKLRRTFSGLFAVVGIGVDVIKFFGSILGQLIKTFFPGVGGGVLDITANFGDLLVAIHKVIKDGEIFQNMLGRTETYIQGFASGIKRAFYVLVGLISEIANGTITIDGIVAVFSDLLSGVKDFLPFGEQLVTMFAIGLRNLEHFVSFASDKLVPVLDWIGEKISNIGLRELGVIAIGVGLITMSRTILKFFSPLGNVLDSFASVLTSVSKSIKDFTLNIKAEALFTMAKAIALLVVSIIALSFIPIEKLKIGLGALTILMGELVAAMLLLNKIENPAKIGMQLTALSAGLFIVAKAAAGFADISWEGLGKAGASIAGFMAIILAFTKLLTVEDIAKFEIQFTTFAAGLVILSGALLVISKIPYNTLTQGVKALSALLGILVLYSRFVKGFNFSMASDGMVKFAAGIVALTGALVLLGNLPFSTLLKGSGALLGLLTILGLYANMVNGKDWSKAKSGLISFGIGIIALTGALAVLGSLPFDTLTKGSVAMLGLLSTLALFVKLTNGKELSVTGGSLIGLGVGLMALTASLAVLGSLDFGTLIQGVAGISLIMTAIAAFIGLTKGGDLGVTAGGMIAFAAGIGILAGVLTLLTLIDTTALMTAASAISGLIVAIGAFSQLTSIGGLVTAALGLGVFALALAGLSIPIKMISDIPWQQLAATAGVIVGAVGMFALVAALMPVFAAIGPLIPPALLGVLGVGAIILEVGLLVAAFGALSRIPGAAEVISDGGTMLLAIGKAIGNFVGGIVGGVGEGVTSALPIIATNISAFGVAIQPFFEAIKGIDGEGVKAVMYLAETLLILGAASIADSLTSWLTGGNSLTTFAAELKAFAPDFVAFANTLAGSNIDADLIQKTANAAKVMAELANSLPNQGNSVAKWFVGDNTLSTFAHELAAFAPDFIKFSNLLSAATIDSDVVLKTANATQAMSELANGLPNQGNSVVKWFVGDNTLSTFAHELAAFAPDFVKFVGLLTAANIDGDVVTKTANAARAMSEVASILPNQGNSVVKWFVGDNTLSTFAHELAAFAPDFVKFAGLLKAADIDGNVVTQTALAAQAMAELADGLPNQGGMAAWFSGENSLSAFAEELAIFAPKFVEFAKTFSTVNSSTIMPGITALNLLVSTMQISGTNSMNSLLAGFENNKEPVIKRIGTVLNDVVHRLADSRADMVTSGGNIVKGLIEGIKGQKTEVRKSVEDVMVDTVKNTIHRGFDMHSPSVDEENDGKNVIQGFINGLLAKKDELVKSLTDITDITKESINDSSLTSGLEGLLEKLTAGFGTTGSETGESFGSGFGEALSQLGATAEGTAKKAKTAFEKFKEWLDEEKFYARIDTAGEISAWEKQLKLYDKGSEERKEIDRELYTLANRLITERYQNEMDAIEKKNYYGKMSLQEELDRLRELKDTFDKDSEERKKINREIFALEKKIYETQKKYIEDVRAAQAKASDERLKAQQDYDTAVAEAEEKAAEDRRKAQKKYDDAVADADKDAAKRRADANDKYNDAIEKAEEDAAAKRLDIEKDLADDMKDIQDKLFKDLEASEKKYADAVKSRADSIYGYYNLFDSVGERKESTPEELLKNLSDQNAAVEDWRYSLEQLKARGVSDALIKELQQLGVSSSGQLSAMLAMTDEQLTEFTSLFDRKHELANSQAISELVDYRAEINDEISALYAQADADMEARIGKYNAALDELNSTLQKEFDEAHETLTKTLTEINDTLTEKTNEAQTTLDETLAEINSTLDTELTKAKTTFTDSMTQINQRLAEQLKTLKENFDETMETVHDKTTKEYKDLNKDLKKELEGLNTEVDTQLKTLETTSDTKTDSAATAMSDNIETGSDDSKESLKDLNNSVNSIFSTFEQSLYNVGLDGANGLANGLNAGQSAVRIAGQSLGYAALNAAKAALDEHSPSKEMEEVGMYGSLGLVNGLVKYMSKVEDAGSAVGQSAIDSLTDTLSTLAMVNLDAFDLSPTITPVLNLSAVRQGANALNALLAGDQSYLMAQNSLVQAQRAAGVQNGTTQTTTTTTINNTFKLEGLSVRSDADIDLIASRLYQKQESASRGRGVRSSISAGRR